MTILSPLDQELAQVQLDIVDGSHILVQHGVLDAFGHVSARHPHSADRFLLSRRLAPALITQSDIREFGLNGELVHQDGTPTFLERYIHSAIYRARPDVQAIVHSHAPSSLAFSVVPSRPLRPICHVCGFLGGGVPLFEIRDVAGDATDLLISNAALGDALATRLGQSNLVLMRGHGSTVVADTVRRAVYRAVLTETNARVQANAHSLGEANFLTDAEAEAAEKTAPLQVERTWEVWRAAVTDGC
ncbi:class II aldolase/adducin family protein [Bradyrhizobium sp. KBS0727]|uniref:class II aldolase/adducin family protein n=1 Tax=unclassified Bradyrhizobium TaxID=2631580 RepID=UPI00110ECA15|nr:MULTISPECIES: class II aldolase/adducin family protein [unclassified Bradyrhizobium]QDW40521.1 class II aldolase/adducin family protein [Bradyrhizobium sp. KBS0725]QDW47126.1 class II aldolase/adducin family protein [Bradyrhizobium sp. KBS0727]